MVGWSAFNGSSPSWQRGVVENAKDDRCPAMFRGIPPLVKAVAGQIDFGESVPTNLI
jgi:hypothetical protein